MNILVITHIYPSIESPSQGTFIKNQIDSILKNKSIHVDLMIIKGPRILKYLKAIAKVFMLNFNKRYAIVHAHYGFSGVVARFQFRSPVIVSFLGSDLLGSHGRIFIKTVYSRFIVLVSRMLSGLISNSIVKSDEMNAIIGFKGYVIPNGVDLKLFKPLEKSYCRKLLGLDSKKYIVLSLANSERFPKRIDLINGAITILQKKNEKIEFLNPNSISHQMVPLYMNAADVYVLPSHSEGSPNVIKEALACNCPVVATDVGDVYKLINGIENCYLCNHDSEDIADKIKKVILSNRISNGRKRIIELGLDIESVANQIVDVYSKTLSKR